MDLTGDLPRSLAVAVPLALASTGLSFWSVWRTRKVFRANGRRAVEQALAARGETPIEITDIPMSAVPQRAGLAAAFMFQVSARDGKGREAAYVWAYEPALVARQPRQLKRFANGIWIPLA